MEQFTHGMQAVGRFVELYGKKNFRQFARYDELIRRFRHKFKSRFCFVAVSPGRVEVVGNHTDHNGGKVLGATVDADIIAAFLPNGNGKVHLEGNNYRSIDFDLCQISQVEGGSVGMVRGVLHGLALRGFKIGGFDAILNSTLPSGAGMSSSAAFQLLVATIQNNLYNGGKISPRVLAEVGQYAENVFFNKPCGLLDQGVIAVGGIVKIDFKNGFDAVRVKNNLSCLDFVVIDTGKSHSSLTEHYAAIPAEMNRVAKLFGQSRLVDVDPSAFFVGFDDVAEAAGMRAALRAKHFFEENARVDRVVTALEQGDAQNFLALLNESGNSSMTQLQNCSVDGDTTVADAVMFAREVCADCASRVHGGGFCGTVLAVVKNDNLSHFVDEMSRRFGKDKVHAVHIRNLGATVL